MSGKIVMFEDDHEFAQEYGDALRERGFKVAWFESPPTNPVAVVVAEDPNLVSLDVTMPTLDGFQVAELLKGDGRTKNIPLVFLTNLDVPAYQERAMAIGADDYIVKSKTAPSDLTRRYEEIISQKEKARRLLSSRQ